MKPILDEDLSARLWDASDEQFIEDSLRRATNTLLSARLAKNSFPPEMRSAMPEPINNWWEAYGKSEITIRRPQPTAKDLQHLESVLPWFYSISDRRTREILFLRSIPLGLRRIGGIVGCSRETVRYLYRAGIAEIRWGLTDLTKFDKMRESLG